jgi:hypothetical protein
MSPGRHSAMRKYFPCSNLSHKSLLTYFAILQGPKLYLQVEIGLTWGWVTVLGHITANCECIFLRDPLHRAIKLFLDLILYITSVFDTTASLLLYKTACLSLLFSSHFKSNPLRGPCWNSLLFCGGVIHVLEIVTVELFVEGPLDSSRFLFVISPVSLLVLILFIGLY